MYICNLTPYKVVVGTDKATFEPCGITARVFSNTEHVKCIPTCNGEKPFATVDICKAVYGDVELYRTVGADGQTHIPTKELPEAEYYIVSSIVADRWEAMRGRMLVTHDFIRDDKGNIVGCKQFRLV